MSTEQKDITSMSPRELIRGLMHGDSAELKLGYDYRNAVLAACNIKGIDGSETIGDLLAYAHGFARGMKDEGDRLPSGYPERPFRAGFNDGQRTRM